MKRGGHEFPYALLSSALASDAGVRAAAVIAAARGMMPRYIEAEEWDVHDKGRHPEAWALIAAVAALDGKDGAK